MPGEVKSRPGGTKNAQPEPAIWKIAGFSARKSRRQESGAQKTNIQGLRGAPQSAFDMDPL